MRAQQRIPSPVGVKEWFGSSVRVASLIWMQPWRQVDSIRLAVFLCAYKQKHGPGDQLECCSFDYTGARVTCCKGWWGPLHMRGSKTCGRGTLSRLHAHLARAGYTWLAPAHRTHLVGSRTGHTREARARHTVGWLARVSQVGRMKQGPAGV